MADREFYGDRTVNRLEKVTTIVSRILYIGGTAFAFLLSFARIAHWQQINDLNDEKKTGIPTFQFFLLLTTPLVLSYLIKKIPAFVGRMRKARLYPRETFIRKGHGTIRDTKTKKGNYETRRHFLHIVHALDPVGVWVEVDEDIYLRARSNNTLPISYHPEKPGMMYVNVEKVETV
ncbi:hypothetical protein DYBT9623_01821 [Dyadobacter sp. CECT 9623]|uniref:Uncharacterized protein n=1 Tax=Dyadobacter linearis TaxID=2823330 RepID=A0ABM8UNU1_9BACT|nr:hypothetical protein [Dyadobacter sp. CECT 9623]CAG5069086.1 hypothetical protein DYBT9623_01821 [Dyadobacter sp. CECT 9623]